MKLQVEHQKGNIIFELKEYREQVINFVEQNFSEFSHEEGKPLIPDRIKKISKKHLIDFHKKVIANQKSHLRVRAAFNNITEEIEALEILEEKIKRTRNFSKQGFFEDIKLKYKIFVKPIFDKMLAFIFGMMSFILIWSEVMLVTGDWIIYLSPIAIYNHNAKKNIVFLIFSILPLTYLCCCVFYSMWQLNISYYYQMNCKRRTDENSLLFNASYLLRLMMPLAYNYADMTHVSGTSFHYIIGHMKVIPFFGSNFNTYFPAIILLLNIGTFFNIYDRIRFKNRENVQQNIILEEKKSFQEEEYEEDKEKQESV